MCVVCASKMIKCCNGNGLKNSSNYCTPCVVANNVVKSPLSPAVVVETNSCDSDSDAKQLVTSPADDDNDDVVMAMDLYPGDDQVNLCLVSAAGDGEDAKVEQRYIRCSNLATVTQLQKFVSLKLFGCLDRHKEVRRPRGLSIYERLSNAFD